MPPCQAGRAPASPKKFCNLLPTLKPFDPERRNLVWQHMWKSSVFLGVSHAPVQSGWSPASPKFLDFVHVLTQYQKWQPNFAYWPNYTWGKCLHGRPWMLTRDLLAVANLVVIQQLEGYMYRYDICILYLVGTSCFVSDRCVKRPPSYAHEATLLCQPVTSIDSVIISIVCSFVCLLLLLLWVLCHRQPILPDIISSYLLKSSKREHLVVAEAGLFTGWMMMPFLLPSQPCQSTALVLGVRQWDLYPADTDDDMQSCVHCATKSTSVSDIV